MTRVLVTGGGGQLGRCVSDLADDPRFAHLDLHVLDRAAIDITDAAAVRAVAERVAPDVIVNAAAFTAVDAAEDAPDTARAVNHDGVANLAALGVRLVHISTDYVFDGSTPTPYVEADPVAPLGVYGHTKELGEQVARQAADHLILRTAWVYSAYGHNFVKTMLRLGAERDELRVVADQVGCPTSAHDLAVAVLVLADTDVAGTYHLAGADEASWHEFAEGVFAAAGLDVRVEAITTAEYPTRAPRPADSRLDGAAITADHGVRLPGWRTSLPGVIEQIRTSSD